MSPDNWINLGGLVLTGFGIVSACIWQLSRTEVRLKDAIAKNRDELLKLVDDKIGGVYRDIEIDRRIVAESLQAVRQSLNDNKVNSLEIFVRRDSFHKFLDTISEARQAFESDIKDRLTELQRKLDRLVERDNART